MEILLKQEQGVVYVFAEDNEFMSFNVMQTISCSNTAKERFLVLIVKKVYFIFDVFFFQKWV